MLLSEIKSAADAAKAAMEAQDRYVQSLGAKITAGEKTIKVFSDDIWTEVKLADFWTIQYNKYLAMSGYAGDLAGLQTNLQTALDGALESILLPEDRTEVQADQPVDNGGEAAADE